jgi:16S rRNA (guanine966-N2)-methyltransferase
MRVIAGIYRGRILKSPADVKTRPTSDRLRETLFNILQTRITDRTNFLDLCAGTGAIGIEALSRGANFVSFVDRSRKACALIEENLDLLEVPEDQTEVFCQTAEKFLAREKEKVWDIIYFDPPYSEDYSFVLNEIGFDAAASLAAEGVFIAEHHSKNILPDLLGAIRRWRIIKQGETRLSFYEKK